jgi:ectoine hydroxylase-related dioxygenase (phytanoyl-CoA dioxygenase family)
VPAEVGTMTFASGSHLLGDLGGGGIGKATDTHLRSVIADRGLPTRTHGALAAGDATFHTGWTAHSAPRNPSDLMRTVMTVIYFADGARVLPSVSEAQDTDRRAWLGDRPLGALADHELNPVLG